MSAARAAGAAAEGGSPLLVIAAGGTGGHMFPAQALAEEMLARGWRVRLSTDERGARYAGGFPKAVEVVTERSATFARGGFLAKLMVPFRLFSGVVSARRTLLADVPSAVVGFGGYPSIPALAAGVMMKLPRALHEQNGVLGKVNQKFAPKVDLVACGTWPTELPAGVQGEYVGNPVRGAIRDQAGAAYAGTAGALEILVLGGSQGARALTDHVPGALASLPEDLRKRLVISHQARPEDLARAAETYAQLGLNAEVQSFFTDVPERMARASLVVSRAGASTLADLTVIGRPAVLVPYALATGNHQLVNARALLAAGAAEVLAEADLTSATLAEKISRILTIPGRAEEMAAAALRLGRPEAAQDLANRIETLAARGNRRSG